MENTFVTTKVDFEETVSRKITRITKKLDKLGIPYTYKVLGTVVRTVAIKDVEPFPSEALVTVGTMDVECVEYVFDMPTYKLGDYMLVAILEHTENGNMVYAYEDNIPEKYRTSSGYCDHCKTKRTRKTTAVLRCVDSNEYIQVGLTCLKDYTGIDCNAIVSGYTDVHDIYLMNDAYPYIMSQSVKRYAPAFTTINYLAHCIKLISTEGYAKRGNVGSTATEAFKCVENNSFVDETYVNKAKQVIDYYKGFTDSTGLSDFDNNIRLALLESHIIRENGFIAYSYVAYTKAMEYKKNEEARKAAVYAGEFVGNVGNKLTFDAKMNLVARWDNYYGSTFLFKFVDANGNTFIWKTGKGLCDLFWDNDWDINEMDGDATYTVRVRGTVKAHTEYRGVNQTELTRCTIKMFKTQVCPT